MRRKGYPYDLRRAGPNSRVKVTHPDGTVDYEPAIYFEAIPFAKLNYHRLHRDKYRARKMGSVCIWLEKEKGVKDDYNNK